MTGLSSQEAARRLKEMGANEVPLPQPSWVREITSRLWGLNAWLLEGALAIEFLMGKTVQAFFIVALLLFAAINGAANKMRTARSLRGLNQQLIPTVRVRRDDRWQTISASKLVPGDLIALKQGELVPADAKIIAGTIRVNEWQVSGESAEITRSQGAVVLSGALVQSGTARLLVTRTGKKSRSGKTVSLINQHPHQGQLQQLLSQIIKDLAIVDAVLVVILVVAAAFRHESLTITLPLVALLIIATIPIAMPASFSVANSIEAGVLGHKGILVNELSSIQEAAKLNVLLVDKTGTLTVDQTQVVAVRNQSRYSENQLIQLAESATNRENPSLIDQALQALLHERHLERLERQEVVPFDFQQKTSGARVAGFGTVRLGSPRTLIPDWDPREEKLARGHRLLALTLNGQPLALFALADPLRKNSRAVIERLQGQGVRVIMLTGDDLATARAVAQTVGLKGKIVQPAELTGDLSQVGGVANVLPEDKLAIVKAFQRRGETVGMIGDGMNDAPAISQAQVGVATANALPVTKQSAGVILSKAGIGELAEVIESGHRVYQRMMTWTITKLTRTAELTIILTLGFCYYGFSPVSTNGLVLLAILNDLVTMVLGTDRTEEKWHPENWTRARLAQLSAILTAGWTILGLGILVWSRARYGTGTTSTIIYVYLIFSAMLTICLSRTTGAWFKSRPSRAVRLTIGLNLLLTVALALGGWGLAPLRLGSIFVLAVIVLAAGSLLDVLKIKFYQVTENKQNPA